MWQQKGREVTPSASCYGDPIGFRARLWELPAPCSLVFLQVTQPEQPRAEAALIVMIILINKTGELGLKEKPFRSTFDLIWCLVGEGDGFSMP